jgi:hypothetical protein
LENSSPDQYPEDAGVFYDAKDALRAALEQTVQRYVSLPDGLAKSDAEFWLSKRAEIIEACRAQGLTIVTTVHGVHLMRLGKIEAQTAALKQPEQEQEPVAFDALVAISLLTHLGGEVADYEDVVEAVRRLHAVNGGLLEALKALCESHSRFSGGVWDKARAAIKKAEGEV